jgi:hypothetical protein
MNWERIAVCNMALIATQAECVCHSQLAASINIGSNPNQRLTSDRIIRLRQEETRATISSPQANPMQHSFCRP